jgi:1-acyl-sn-glycerol-3-phosphate acyltransferase|tara:strand:+ start:1567 stop:2250 length:684 start_codon:yes stop_codon:yes gene_type:complete
MEQMTPQPDLAEQAAIISTMRFVKTMMGLFTRSDIGPPPDIPPGPAIYAANHRSLADLLLASITFHSWGRPIRPLVASSYFRKPGIGPLLSRLRCIPVDGSIALELAVVEIEAGWSVAIMPEGRVVPPEEWNADGVGRLHSGVGRLALDTGLPVVANGASGTEGFWPRGATGPRIRPWGRYPLALRSEVLGVITAATSREATEIIRDALVRCTTQADSVTREMRRGR